MDGWMDKADIISQIMFFLTLMSFEMSDKATNFSA